jgi:hypothetical protein
MEVEESKTTEAGTDGSIALASLVAKDAAMATKGAAVDESEAAKIAPFSSAVTTVWLACKEAKKANESDQWLAKHAKTCPKAVGGCGVITARDGGCSHMKCQVCKFEWCWLCGGKYRNKYTFGAKCPCGSG